MPYRPRYDQSEAVTAIFGPSLSAAAIGAAIISFFVLLSGFPPTALLLVFPIAFLAGLIGVVFCLALFGPITRMALQTWGLSGTAGAARALAAAILISSIPALIFGSINAIAVVLPFAIPAAFFYRRELLWRSQ